MPPPPESLPATTSAWVGAVLSLAMLAVPLPTVPAVPGQRCRSVAIGPK
ncbi:MAG: hypothetical protein INH41_21250 [Myxococcaceae bacterium]|jgi:hypothetical protein|nr:hypothetical protein [Myxococcaceae bacterium]MCA3014921.1 hypothetical protein [Myxococcaceae bacterium]